MGSEHVRPKAFMCADKEAAKHILGMRLVCSSFAS